MIPVPLRIANARGVPGCAGLLLAGADLMVTNHHVAFGAGAAPGDTVWAIPPGAGRDVRHAAVCLGTARHGVIGRIGSGETAVFVDCALVELARARDAPRWLAETLAQNWPQPGDRPALHDQVSKTGPATGVTAGRVLDLDHCDCPSDGDTVRTASGQVLIASANPALAFAGRGDSGAAIVDARARAIGLLWGISGNGDGIASPITAVLEALGIGMNASGMECA
ncbi:S1 family peptidase [Mesorhizobium sp. CO1-1-8]|uniref:S1 family peptidase n=1 Tax=Mesorhizobium sp. CO1-1-8 TaxID=2876631 RepID=UPI001CD0CAA3|nr:S1 family peptidase [Mesorhizobium sp. CO1-1-8]MBZ9772624.1 S1 family peptidase [Mesorhizobium sp. CO1-1-8]